MTSLKHACLTQPWQLWSLQHVDMLAQLFIGLLAVAWEVREINTYGLARPQGIFHLFTFLLHTCSYLPYPGKNQRSRTPTLEEKLSCAPGLLVSGQGHVCPHMCVPMLPRLHMSHPASGTAQSGKDSSWESIRGEEESITHVHPVLNHLVSSTCLTSIQKWSYFMQGRPLPVTELLCMNAAQRHNFQWDIWSCFRIGTCQGCKLSHRIVES